MNEAMQDEREALVARYVAAYNAFDVETMLSLLTPDVRFENHANGQLTASADGVDAFRALAEAAAVLFADREQRVTSLRVDGDGAVARIDYRGTLAADVPGGPGAGSVLELAGRTEFGFRDGRICRIVDRS
ncbi:nuclear transport factor 2 family protein [Lysobacter sp.]|uniref:nuclear transport factor 2 family protein n=1 Tax=Lysobacter sp. TaxID=72226 RepID=UPI002D71CB30|nr:nuclear transport factor 2 family protein [Lysobacter sp.]HZX77075.1 nuclear transport factor 2 family protein [Lysobacter sp.]